MKISQQLHVVSFSSSQNVYLVIEREKDYKVIGYISTGRRGSMLTKIGGSYPKSAILYGGATTIREATEEDIELAAMNEL